jgi:predicted pyridoxine 5'-phosphate oxidase superfamily flavin-nucleotide-binding protein
MTTNPGAASQSPWHEGERAIQARVGSAERLARIGSRAIRDFMPDQHRAFFAQLPFLVVGSVAADGFPWASILAGTPGFASSPDPRSLVIASRPVAGDPLADALTLGARLGVLGIELPTRRRNRMNGRVTAIGAADITVAVDQSFGNCPQYIQRRDYEPATEAERRSVGAESFTALDAAARALVAASDTSFVASFARGDDGTPRYGVDVSHRGGRPGFVGIDDDGALVVPDYAGNGFFNTLGNLMVNPRAGLLFVDFASGDLLQVTGTTTIVWDGPLLDAFAGAERLWRLAPVRGRWLRGALPLRLALREFSPTLAGTGTWREAQAAVVPSRPTT